MKISNDLNADKIKYYTNVLIAGALAVAPIAYWVQINYPTKETLFITAVFLSILFFGRLCLEIGLVIESHCVDSKINKEISQKGIVRYYKEFRECENVLNGNWYKYLKSDENKAAKEVISHMVDRMLFLLSSMVGLIFGVIFYFFLLNKYSSTSLNLSIIIFSFVYILFSIWRVKGLAAGLDFLRYLIINGDPCI
jgi:hypothetical protein